ncbi:MAG: TRAP transporter large permease [Planctomycetes bacterium]|nr:TRAP transporter large permease [Planctomycetota bacterium]
MSNTILISSVVLLGLLFFGIPVFVSLLAGSACYFALANVPTLIIAQRIIAGVESIPLLAVPFFVATGVFMNYSGVTRRVMDFCEVLVGGRVPGGLAQVNVLLSTLMGGLSGSNLADAAMQSKMLVPEMIKKGFSKPFSTVVTATSAMITPLIPPGIAMIIYGSIANVSIGRLFIAGIGPGVLLCLSLMILVAIISSRRNYNSEPDPEVIRAGFLHALKRAFLPLCLPVVIIGGIRLGVFTPTEAGAVAIIYGLGLGLLYREMTFSTLITGLKDTVITTASIMVIVGGASAFAWILTRERVPQNLTAFIVANISNKYLFLVAVNVFLIIVGMFIEGNASMIVLVPILVPSAKAFGINEIQFAIVVIFNLAIGCITPPMGTLMFVTCGVTKCSYRDFIKECVPFYLLLLICLILLTFVPFFSQGVVELLWRD